MKKSLLSLLLCLSLCCSGCSATQVKDRLYLQSLELSNYRYPTVQLHAFQSEEADCSGSGSTLSAALESAEIPAGKSLFLGHLELLALQEPKFYSNFQICYSNIAFLQAASCSYTTRSLAEVNTETLLESLKQEEQNGRMPKTDLLSILKERCNSSGTALLPFRITNGFSMVLMDSDGSTQTLSNDAIQRAVLAAGQQLSETSQLIGRWSGKRLSDYQCFDQIHRHHRKWHSHCNRFDFHSWNGKCCRSARTAETACEAAERETIQQNQADVIELEACLRQQCYKSYIRNRTGTACSAPYNFNMNLRFSHKPKQTALCFHTKRSAFFINSDCSEKELTCSVLLRSYPVHPSVQPVPCRPLLRCLLYNISAFLRFPSSTDQYLQRAACPEQLVLLHLRYQSGSGLPFFGR